MRHDFRYGFLATVPIGFTIVSFGVVCGALSAKNGMTLVELLLMNLFVFGGPGQFIMAEMWSSSSLDIIGILIAALLINLRYFLMGAALHPLFAQSMLFGKIIYIHLLGEPNWALTLARLKTQPVTPLYLFGGGVCMLFSWMSGTVAGFFLGANLSNPAAYGLDFALVAMILTLLPGMYRGRSDLLPWCVAGLCAWLCKQGLPGNLYILAGALAGSLSSLVSRKKGVDNA